MIGAHKQQALSWSNVDQDQWLQMVSQDHNQLTYSSLAMSPHKSMRK